MLNSQFRTIFTPGYKAIDSEKTMQMDTMEIGLVM